MADDPRGSRAPGRDSALSPGSDLVDDVVAASRLDPRAIAVVLIALGVSPTITSPALLRRGLRGSAELGITQDDVREVRRLASLVAVHAVTSGLEAMSEVLHELGHVPPDLSDGAARRRLDYLNGSEHREWGPGKQLASAHASAMHDVVLDYVDKAGDRSSLTWRERELICVALVVNASHIFPAGLRRHSLAALRAGATESELVEVGVLSTAIALSSFEVGLP